MKPREFMENKLVQKGKRIAEIKEKLLPMIEKYEIGDDPKPIEELYNEWSRKQSILSDEPLVVGDHILKRIIHDPCSYDEKGKYNGSVLYLDGYVIKVG